MKPIIIHFLTIFTFLSLTGMGKKNEITNFQMLSNHISDSYTKIEKPEKFERTYLEGGNYEDRFWTTFYAEHATFSLAISFVYNSSGTMLYAQCEGGYGYPKPFSKYHAVMLNSTFPFEGVPSGDNCAHFSYDINYLGLYGNSELPNWDSFSEFWDEVICR